MVLDIYRSDAARGQVHWSGHGEYARTQDPALEPCPFCASPLIDISNTHTPFYQAECMACGATGPAGQPARGGDRPIRTERRCRQLHQEAFDQAVTLWNQRARKGLR